MADGGLDTQTTLCNCSVKVGVSKSIRKNGLDTETRPDSPLQLSVISEQKSINNYKSIDVISHTEN